MNAFFAGLKKEINTHGVDYLLLIVSGVFFLFLLRLFQGQRLSSFLVVFVFVIFYIFWAIYHHSKIGALEFKNVVEYVLIGCTVLLFVGVMLLL